MTSENGPPGPAPDEAFTTQEVRQALSDILRSRQFQGASRLCDFLSHIVEKKLAGQEQYLKEYVLGTDVLGRAANYDPRIDPIVRSHAGRLRKKLDEYYAEHGQQAEVVISLPKGHYIPAFARRAPTPPAPEWGAAEESALQPEAGGLSGETASSQRNEHPPSAATSTGTASAFSIVAGRRRWVLGLIALAAIGGAALGWAGVNWLNRLQAAPEAAATVAKAPDSAGVVAAGQVAAAPEIDGLPDTAWANRVAQRIEKKLKGGDAIRP